MYVVADDVTFYRWLRPLQQKFSFDENSSCFEVVFLLLATALHSLSLFSSQTWTTAVLGNCWWCLEGEQRQHCNIYVRFCYFYVYRRTTTGCINSHSRPNCWQLLLVSFFSALLNATSKGAITFHINILFFLSFVNFFICQRRRLDYNFFSFYMYFSIF